MVGWHLAQFSSGSSPDTPVMVMKGQVAHWLGFQEDVGTDTDTELAGGLEMVMGGMTTLIS